MKSIKAQEEGVFKPTELQLPDQYHRGELHVGDWQQFPEGEQQVEEKYDFVEGILVFRVGMAWNDDHICLRSVLCELKSRVWIQESQVQPHGMPSVKVMLARKPQGLRHGERW